MEKSKKMMLSLALVAVIAVAAIGIGYAYQASTSNSGNTVAPGYMTVTLTNGSSQPAYSDRFDANVMYDTLTTFEGGREFVTYTFNTEQMAADIDGGENNAIEIGSVYLNISYENATSPFVILMANDGTGVMSAKYTYKIGYSYGANEAAADSAYSTATTYAFDPINGIALVGPTEGKFTNEAVVLVKLYITGMTGSPQKLPIDEAASLIKPMDDVTFKFTAITTDPKFTVTLPGSFEGGTITASPSTLTGLIPGTTITFTVTPSANYGLAAFSFNGVDSLADVIFDAGVGTVTLTIDSSDVTVAATFKAELTSLAVTLADATTATIAETNPNVSGNTGSGAVLIEYKLTAAEDSTYTIVKPSTVGEYTVRATVAETAGYLSKSVTDTFEITAA